MKIYRLIIFLALSSLFLSAYGFAPKTETTPNYLRITDVERTDTSLRLSVKLQHLPNYWVRIPSSTSLIAPENDSIRYKIIGSEGISLDRQVYMPASGYQDGVLIFEKVPSEVKLVDMVESDPEDISCNVMGIRLDEPEYRKQPKMITFSDILNDGEKPSEAWSGFDPERYKDLSFYDKNGTTHLKGKIDNYSPRYGVSTFSIRTNDDFICNEKVNVGEINPDGTFDIDLPVRYPQYSFYEFGDFSEFLFLIPGDTLSILTSMDKVVNPKRGFVPEYFGFEGGVDDGVVINMLMDSIINKRYPLDDLYRPSRYNVSGSASMEEEIYQSNERLAQLLDSVVSDLPVLLKDLPISAFAKDALSVLTIAEIVGRMEYLEMEFRIKNGPSMKVNDDGKYIFNPGKKLDLSRLLAPRMKHIALMYDNPLLLCHGPGARTDWENNAAFNLCRWTANGYLPYLDGNGNETGSYQMAKDLSVPFGINDNFLDSIGVGNCFAAQLIRTSSFINELNTTQIPSSENLDFCVRLMPKIIRRNDSDVLNEILINAYNNYVKDILISENDFGHASDNSIIIDDSADGDIFDKIIAPYKGNVLFIDFWAIWCKPCRRGMMMQKNIMEKLADRPFKAIYVANTEDGVEACNKWLRNEEIKGEHIFVNGDDWKRLCDRFNIKAIPFGILVGKDGKIIKTDFNIESEDKLLHRALEN